MKAKILYIEDNEQNRYLVSYLLTANGYEVNQAIDGQEGIDMATQNDYDLILLDIQLPVMDGYAVAKNLRKVSTLKTIPIIAVTSYAMAGDKEKSLEAGCSGYIEKPINPDTFIAQVENFLPEKI